MVHLEDPADELNDEVQCMKEVKVHVLVMHEQSPFDNRKKTCASYVQVYIMYSLGMIDFTFPTVIVRNDNYI